MTPLSLLISEAGLKPLRPETLQNFATYLSLILKWNAKLNLTAVRLPEEILARHFVESIFCAQNLPEEIMTLVDFGSGAGFPGLPIAMCRPDIAVTLAECNLKKASFLREAIRETGAGACVYGERAEFLKKTFDCVTLRAVDKMAQATLDARSLIGLRGYMVLLVGENFKLPNSLLDIAWNEPLSLPNSRQSVMMVGRVGG